MKSTYSSGSFFGDDDNDNINDDDDNADDDDDKDYGDVLHLFEVRSQCGSLRLWKRRDCEALVRIGGSGQLENMTKMMIRMM